MRKWYKEYDHDAYSLRFMNSWTVFVDNNDVLHQAYVIELEDHGMIVKHFDGENAVKNLAYKDYHPIYHYVPSRFYMSNDDGVLSLLKKKLVKSFQIGVSPKNYDIAYVSWDNKKANQKDLYPKLLNELKFSVDETLENNGGLISDRILLSRSDIYYLDIPIGMRKGNNFVVNGYFKSELEDCLRGKKCSIST